MRELYDQETFSLTTAFNFYFIFICMIIKCWFYDAAEHICDLIYMRPLLVTFEDDIWGPENWLVEGWKCSQLIMDSYILLY